jgi:hypothetical protein
MTEAAHLEGPGHHDHVHVGARPTSAELGDAHQIRLAEL